MARIGFLIPFILATVVLASPQQPHSSVAGPIYQIGDGVSAPKIITAPPPDFPDIALHGEYLPAAVLLRMTVDSEGVARDVIVLRSTGPGAFDEKALEAARKYRFKPALKDGKPVAVTMTVEVKFAKK